MFSELFKTYANRNSELRSVAKLCYEFGYTVASENSAAHSYGLDEHTIERQREFISKARAKIAALAAKPLPDRQGAARVQFPIDMTTPYITYTEDVNGNPTPVNEATQLLQEQWMIIASELATSQSASLAGSLVSHDAKRALNNVSALEKLLDEMAEDDTFIDLPSSARPGSNFGPIKKAGG